MSYNISIARISNDLKSIVEITEKDWLNCQIENKIIYSVQEGFPSYCLNFKSSGFVDSLGIDKDFNSGFIDSAVFYNNDREVVRLVEKYILHIANSLEAIIFGEVSELYFIPEIGLIDKDKCFINQTKLTIDELLNEGIYLNNNETHKILNIIERNKNKPTFSIFDNQ